MVSDPVIFKIMFYLEDLIEETASFKDTRAQLLLLCFKIL